MFGECYGNRIYSYSWEDTWSHVFQEIHWVEQEWQTRIDKNNRKFVPIIS